MILDNREIQSAQAPQGVEPGEANFEWEWIDGLAALGFTVARVEIELPKAGASQIFPGFEHQIDQQMRGAELGHFDSLLRHSTSFSLFFYVDSKRLADGLSFLRAALEKFELLALSKVSCADAGDRVWVVHYPTLRWGDQ